MRHSAILVFANKQDMVCSMQHTLVLYAPLFFVAPLLLSSCAPFCCTHLLSPPSQCTERSHVNIRGV